MGIRCDQHMGLPQGALDFLKEREVAQKQCPHCKQLMPSVLEQIGRYKGMFGDDYVLHRHILTNGDTADEFLQAAPWSAGPMFFLGLRVSDGQIIKWSIKEIDELSQ
jgi:hypothetical protein